MTDHTGDPDYQLEGHLVLRTPAQIRAATNPTRVRILTLLAERAASTSQLAAAFAQPKGTIAHHIKILESAGLIQVVRTRQVRAITERFYGRVARTFELAAGPGLEHPELAFLRVVASEIKPPSPDDPPEFSVVRARLPRHQARAFAERLRALLDEFRAHADPKEQLYGFLAGVYPVDVPALPPDDPEDRGTAEDPVGPEDPEGPKARRRPRGPQVREGSEGPAAPTPPQAGADG